MIFHDSYGFQQKSKFPEKNKSKLKVLSTKKTQFVKHLTVFYC